MRLWLRLNRDSVSQDIKNEYVKPAAGEALDEAKWKARTTRAKAKPA